MKIILATDYYFPTTGGVSTAVHRLAQALHKKGHNVSIIAPSTSWDSYAEEVEGVTVYRIRSVLVQKTRHVRQSPSFLHKKDVEEIVAAVFPDIVHVCSPEFISQSVAQAAKKYEIPVIGTSHIMPENLIGALPIPHKIGKAVIGNIYMKQIIGFYNKLDYMTAPTATAVNILRANKLTSSVKAISNGIDLSSFTAIKPKNLQTIAKKYKLQKKPIVLYVGRLDKEKRIDTLVKAVTFLPKQLDLQVVIAGHGIQAESLKRLTKKLHLSRRITFTGFIPDEDLSLLYAASDIFVIPSIAELQCLVAMEAMASGLPVIAAKAVALPDLVKDKKNGFLFTPNMPKDLAGKLAIVLQDKKLRKAMGEESKRSIQMHDMEKIVGQFEALYSKVIREHFVGIYTKASLPAKKQLSQKISKFFTPLIHEFLL